MGGSNDWRTQITGEDWMRSQEKRLLHEERRPQVRAASDILGPGIAPYCIRLEDWNADETLFNGFWYSEPGAFNSPNNTRYWIGTSLTIEGGWGIQRVSEYFGTTTDVLWPRPVYTRKFWTASPDAPRSWSLWRLEDGTPPGIISDYGGSSTFPTAYSTANNSTAWTAASGFTITRQETRRVGTNLLFTDVEWTRTGGTVTFPVSGDIANTLVATLSSEYTLLSGQNALSSGQEGRVSHYNLYSNRQISITSVGGTVDYPTAGSTGSFGGAFPVAALATTPAAPVGTAPAGWFYCNGIVINRASYPDLFAAIGTRWNTGGETADQFRIPSLPGKVIKA